MAEQRTRRPLVSAGIVLGMGFAAFFDGIVLHQILQWHHMLTSAGYPSTTVAGLQINTLADGLFHLGAYVLTGIGVILLWRATRRRNASWSGRVFGGAVLMGAGLFNFVEGMINHQLLGIHHVRTGPNQLVYDLAYLAISLMMIGIGWWLVRNVQPQTATARTVPSTKHR